MSLLEVLTVVRAEFLPDVVDGANIDLPRVGDCVEQQVFKIQGWVAGHAQPALRVELLAAGQVVGTFPVDIPRPDVEAHFPRSAFAAASGFSGTADVRGFDVLSFQVDAVFRDTRAALGWITVRGAWFESDHPAERDVVSVIIPCFNQAHFLGEAIESVLAQTYPHVEIVVVDDGSADNVAEVVGRYPGVKYVRQQNAGLSAARNLGLRNSNGQFVVFLDCDDLLRPDALALNVALCHERPACAFVYGEFRDIGVRRAVQEEWQRPVVTGDAYTELLKGNYIGMHGAVMYRRAVFQTVRGFDESLEACEDYDLYLRIARLFPIAGHGQLVAEYRRHGAAMSADFVKMLRTSLAVLQSQWPFVRTEPSRRQAYRLGQQWWRAYYGSRVRSQALARLWLRGQRLPAVRALAALLRYAPGQLFKLNSRGLLEE